MFKTKLEVDRHVDHSLKKINNETERNLRCFSFAKLYFNVGDYEQTCRYVSSYLSVKPKSPEGYQLLGKALEKLGKKEAALEAYRTSLQLDPKQNNLVIKVCELLASDDVDMDQSGARYFCDLAQSFDPHNPAVFSLRERLITTENDNPMEVSKLLLKELETRPTDVNLRVRLLKHFLQNNMIKEAYKHASAIEEKNLSIFHNNLGWYETFAEVLVRFQRDLTYSSQLTWEFWFLSVSVLDRLVALSLDEHLDTVKTSTEYLTAVFNFDQMLSKASQNIQACPDRQLVMVFLNHYHAQLYFHLATLVFKQAKKDLIQFKEASNITLPVLLAAYHSSPPDLQSMWLVHSPENRRRLVHHWHKEASYRCSQSGHILLAAAKDRKTIILEKATHYSTGMWREQLFKKVFVKRDQQLKMSTSFFVSNSQSLEPVIKLPDHLDLAKYDEVAQLVHPDSLHHYIWLGLNSKLSDMEVKSFDGLQYSIKNLNNCAAEALNILDIQAFLYCATLCAKSKLEKNLIYCNHDKPSVLPACVTNHLGTLNQSKFVTAAYKMYKNEQGANMGEVRLLLIKAIEVVRCVGHHGLDVRLLVTLAKIFEERAKRLTKQSEIEFNDARAELYWKTALPLLEKIRNNQMITYSNNRLFEYKGKDVSISEVSTYIESGKLFTAIQLMKKKEYEKALHIFEQLKDPYASFYQSEIYKHMADQKTSQNKENVTSEMRSQNIILLSRARDCLYLTLDRLREPSVDRAHPLNSQLGTEIEKIERLLSRIDPDCTNRNECDGMSDENPSSDNSTGEHYLSTYTNHTSFHNGPPYTPKHDSHNHSTPLRFNISRQEAPPSLERLDAQIRQMAASRDTTLTSILEQVKIMVESHRSLLDELRSFKDTTVDDLKSVKKGFEELKDVKKSVEELKSSVDELQNVVDVVQEMKKEINELKNHTKNNQLSDEDLYVLDPDYGVDYNINSNIGAYNTNLPAVYPNYQPGRMGNTNNLAAAYAPPGLYPGLYPGLTYAYGGLGLPQPGTLPFVPDQQLPSISASVAASYNQPILGQPSLTQGLPSTSLLTGQILSHTVPHITQSVKESPKAAISVTVSTTQTLFPPSASISTTTTISNKAAPVNVVITNSDPLPTTRAPLSQPVLSVTIPPQHIKGNMAKSQPHNYQIPLPSLAAAVITSTPSVLSKPPPAISTQSLLSNISPPVFSAVSQTKSPSKNVSLGLQIEKTLDQTFSPDKNSSTLNRSNVSTNSVEEHDPCPDFKPIIPLPDEVPVNTGEECETELFCERAKLFRHVNNNGVKEWKERGVGNLKILRNPNSDKIRILMRRDQVHKICANHFITRDMLLTPMANNDRAYVWAAHDFADEAVVLEKFCVRFKTAEEAKKFYEAFESAKKLVRDVPKTDTNVKKSELQCTEDVATSKPTTPATTSLGGFVFTSTPSFKPKEAATPVKVVEVEQPSKSSPFSSFTFGKGSNVTPVIFKSEFKPVQTTEATTFSPLVISQSKPATPQKEDADDDSHAEEFVPTAEFKPVIALPELVDHKTGEENSEVLFEGRAKLFRYDTNGQEKEWKERGVGIIKILKDESVRLLMRRDQVLKVCCNHKVLKNMSFKLNSTNPKAVVWHAQDFSEGVLTPETFTVRFKTEEQANQFLQVLQTAQTSLDENNKVSGKHHKPEARPRTTSFGDKFKPAKGSWECKNCYIINEGKTNHCIACESPKPGSTAKKPDESGLSGPVFSFGIPTSQADTTAVEGAKTGSFSFAQKPALDTSKGISLETPGQKFTFGIPQTATATTTPAKTFAFGTPTTATAGATTQFSFGAKSNLETKTSNVFGTPTNTTFSFTPTTDTTPTKSESKFVFGSPQKHEFEFKPRSPRRVSAGQGDEESDGSYVEEEEDNIYFKPVIPLPDKVEVKTGEEDESVLYCHRAKLFRFVGGEWKERGLGDVKILKSNANGKLRVVMRREQVLKICLNHHLTKETDYIPKDEKSWLFHAADFSEGEIAHEQFCIRFKNAEIAQEFRKAVSDAVEKADGGDADKKDSVVKEDSDDEVIIVSETKVTQEEEKEAIKLGLPPKFFSYRQLPDCTCEQCKKDDEYLKELFADNKTRQVKTLSASSTPTQRLNSSSTTVFTTPSNVTPSTASSTFGTPKEQTSFSFTPAQPTKSDTLRDLLLKPSKLESPVSAAQGQAEESAPATPTTTTNSKTSAINTFSFSIAKTTASTPSTTAPFSIFGTSTGGLFGSSSTSTNLFSSPSASSTGSSIFGSSTSTLGDTSSSTTPVFGSLSSSSTSIFGVKPAPGAATTPIFGGVTSTNSNIFSISTTPSNVSIPSTALTKVFSTTSTTPIFGTAKTTATTPVFGTTTSGTSIFSTTTTTTTPVFGSATSIVPIFGTTTPTTPVFGAATSSAPISSAAKDTPVLTATATTTSTPIFGISKTTSGTPVFGGAATTPGSIFGGSAPTTTPSGGIFGQNANIFGSKGSGIFGSQATSGSSPFSSPAVTSTSIFGTAQGGSVFGGKTDTVFGNTTSIFGNKSTPTTEANLTFGSKAKGEDKSTINLKEDDEVVLKCENELTFASLAANTSATAPAFSKSGDNTFAFLGAGAPVFSSHKNVKKEKAKADKSKTESDEEEGAHGEEEYDPHYEPIVPLPDAIVVSTGEENEDVLFNERAKLFRFDANTKEWKERGVGQMKVLHHPQNNTYRLLLRREQVHKVVLNQLVVPNLDLQPSLTSDKAWMWAGYNYVEDDNNLEKLAVRFKNVELAKKFYDVMQEVIKKVTEIQNSKSLPSTVQNYGLEDVGGDDQNTAGDVNNEDDEDEDDDDEDDRSVMFMKRCTLSEQLPDGTWKQVTMGDLQVYYDPELYAARISVNDDSGNVLSNTLIGMNTTMDIEKAECTWKAVEWADGDMKWRRLKATFSSDVAAQEFHSCYLEGLNYAQEVGIIDEIPHENDTETED